MSDGIVGPDGFVTWISGSGIFCKEEVMSDKETRERYLLYVVSGDKFLSLRIEGDELIREGELTLDEAMEVMCAGVQKDTSPFSHIALEESTGSPGEYPKFTLSVHQKNTMREEFEKWFLDSHAQEEYGDTDYAWTVWQAALGQRMPSLIDRKAAEKLIDLQAENERLKADNAYIINTINSTGQRMPNEAEAVEVIAQAIFSDLPYEGFEDCLDTATNAYRALKSLMESGE